VDINIQRCPIAINNCPVAVYTVEVIWRLSGFLETFENPPKNTQVLVHFHVDIILLDVCLQIWSEDPPCLNRPCSVVLGYYIYVCGQGSMKS
jgi:hypothetical protein